PDVDHVVIALLCRNQTRRVLLVDFLYLGAGLGKDVFLDRRDQHVAHRDRNTTARGEAEAGLHELVGEDDRSPQAAATEGLIDETRDLFLFERTIKHRKRQALGQDFGQ